MSWRLILYISLSLKLLLIVQKLNNESFRDRTRPIFQPVYAECLSIMVLAMTQPRHRVFWSSVQLPITKSQLIEPPIHDSGLINLTFCVESNPRLRCFCFTLLCDWSKKLAPFSLPISSVKSKINRVFVIRILPLHRQVTRCYLSPHWLLVILLFALIGCCSCVSFRYKTLTKWKSALRFKIVLTLKYRFITMAEWLLPKKESRILIGILVIRVICDQNDMTREFTTYS